MWKLRGNLLIIALFATWMSGPCAYGQDDLGNQKLSKRTWYGALGIGGIVTNVKNGGDFTFAGGVDLGLGHRLGIQFEGGTLFGVVYEDAGFGFVSPSLSVHPANWKDRQTDFFLNAGYTFLGNSYRSHNLICLGGGFSYWRTPASSVGLRIDFRDQIGRAVEFLHDATGLIHLYQIRIGFAIR